MRFPALCLLALSLVAGSAPPAAAEDAPPSPGPAPAPEPAPPPSPASEPAPAPPSLTPEAPSAGPGTSPVSALVVALPPQALRAPQPVFPAEALAAGVEGTAVLEASIDAAGRWVSVDIVRDPGHGLGGAARQALLATPYDPGLDDGDRPVAVDHLFVRIPVLSDQVPDPPPVAGTPGPELTKSPELGAFVEAPYPPGAAAAGVSGSPQLAIDVDEHGEVMDVRVVRPAGHGFDEAAVRAAWQFRFVPGQAGDVPVAVTVTYGYNFALKEELVPAAEAAAPAPDGASAGGGGAEVPVTPGVVNLSGVVRERGTRTALPDVEVLIEELDRTAMSDARGRFTFQDVPPGIYNVLVASPGFERFRTEEEIRPGEAVDVVYYVRPTPAGRNQTVVRVKQEKKEVARRTLEIATLEKIPGTFGDPIKAVQNLPGVARAPFDFGLLLVRGSAPEDTGVYVDGVRVPLIYHFGGLRSVLSPILIDSIDFLPGGYGVTYGRTSGGALDVKSRLDFPKELHGLLRIDLIDAEVAAVGPLPKKGDPANPIGGFAVAARRSWIDVVLPVLAPPDLDLSRTTLPRWFDVSGKVMLRPTPGVRFGWFGYYSDDAAGIYSDDPIDSHDPNTTGEISTAIRFTRQILYADLRPSDRFRFTANVAYGYDYTLFDITQAFRLDSGSHNISARADAFGEVAPWLALHGGVDAIFGHYDFEVSLSSWDVQSGFEDPNAEREPLLIEGRDEGGGVAGYLEAVVRPWQRLSLQPGLRLDYYAVPGVFSAATLDPRFNFRLDLGRGATVKGSAGLYHQNPQPFEWVEGTGNPDLRPESSYQFTLGWEQRFTSFFSVDVDLFYKKLEDLVVPVFYSDNEAGDRLIWDNTGDGTIYGGELMVEMKPWKGLQGWIAYTFQRSLRRDSPEDDWYRYDFDQPHILDVVARYALPWDLSVGLRFRVTSGNPYTTAERMLYDVDAFTYTAISGEYNAERLPTFHQLDLRIDKEFRFRTFRISTYVEVLNVYNQRNVEQIIYNFDYSEEAWIYSLPILPNLGLRLDF